MSGVVQQVIFIMHSVSAAIMYSCKVKMTMVINGDQ